MRIVNLCLVLAALLALPSAAAQQPAPRAAQKATAQQPARPAAGAQKKPVAKPKPAPPKRTFAESSLGSAERRALLASKGRTAAVKKPTKPVY